jgi:hypothetical protein
MAVNDCRGVLSLPKIKLRLDRPGFCDNPVDPSLATLVYKGKDKFLNLARKAARLKKSLAKLSEEGINSPLVNIQLPPALQGNKELSARLEETFLKPAKEKLYNEIIEYKSTELMILERHCSVDYCTKVILQDVEEVLEPLKRYEYEDVYYDKWVRAYLYTRELLSNAIVQLTAEEQANVKAAKLPQQWVKTSNFLGKRKPSSSVRSASPPATTEKTENSAPTSSTSTSPSEAAAEGNQKACDATTQASETPEMGTARKTRPGQHNPGIHAAGSGSATISSAEISLPGDKSKKIKSSVLIYEPDLCKSKSFHNLSTVAIPEHVAKLLNKGAKYTPESNINIDQVTSLFNSAIAELKVALGEHSHSNNVWFWELFNTEFTRSVSKYKKRHKDVFSVNKVSRFLADSQLIGKLSDKNLGLTIMPFDWYNDVTLEHLESSKYYEKVGSIDFMSIKKGIWEISERYRSTLTPADYRTLRGVPIDPTLPEFYVIPKLHKTPVAVRPIVPSLNWITTNAAKWLDKALQPVVSTFEWIVPNSIAVIKHIEATKLTRKCVLVTADATSLYTNIQLEEGFRKVKALLLTHKAANVNLLIEVLRWVMCNNFFQYNNRLYWQKCGTAMGSNAAPVFANLFVAFHEEKIRENYKNLWPPVYYRYLDDIFFVWKQGEAKLREFQRILNTRTPSLEFNFVESRKTAHFLDLTLRKGKRFAESRVLDLRTHTKPENPHLYTDPSTYQPDHIRYNWIQGECIRLARSCSNVVQYNEQLIKFKRNLEKRGYPEQQILGQFLKIAYTERAAYLSPNKDTSTEKTENPAVFLKVKNIPGRHLVIKYIRKLVHIASTIPAYAEAAARVKLVVTRGRTVLDIVNASCKKVFCSLKVGEQNEQSDDFSERSLPHFKPAKAISSWTNQDSSGRLAKCKKSVCTDTFSPPKKIKLD